MPRSKATKRRSPSGDSYWNAISDDELLKRNLEVEQPHLVEGLVFELPENEAEPFVEFFYDLRGGSHQKLRCIHCHQPHLKGFIVNQGGGRFYVGHICGAHIYGEKFNDLKVDFDAAVERRAMVSRVRRVRAMLDPFNAWVHSVTASGVFDAYKGLFRRWYGEFYWLFDHLLEIERGSGRLRSSAGDCVLPTQTFFYKNADPERAFKNAASEFGIACLTLMKEAPTNTDVELTLSRIPSLLARLERAINQLEEVELFFQPNVLKIVAAWATQHDNPGRRKWVAGLNDLTRISDGTHRDVLQIPFSYRVPSKEPIAMFRAALAGIPENVAQSDAPKPNFDKAAN